MWCYGLGIVLVAGVSCAFVLFHFQDVEAFAFILRGNWNHGMFEFKRQQILGFGKNINIYKCNYKKNFFL